MLYQREWNSEKETNGNSGAEELNKWDEENNRKHWKKKRSYGEKKLVNLKVEI